MRYTITYDKGKWDGYGNFDCSVCGKDVFIQYDSYEKDSTGELTVWKGRCYCLCDKCIRKCMDKGKAKLLKDARPYEPTDEEEEEPEWMKKIPTEYHSIASMLPAIVLLGTIYLIAKEPKEKRKELMKKLIKELKKGDRNDD